MDPVRKSRFVRLTAPGGSIGYLADYTDGVPISMDASIVIII